MGRTTLRDPIRRNPSIEPEGGPLHRAALFLVRRACSTAFGCRSRPNLMEVKGSEAQGCHREVGSEGSVEQRYGPMPQEPDQRPTASDELANDNQVCIHQGR